jgi:hypothetical protein
MHIQMYMYICIPLPSLKMYVNMHILYINLCILTNIITFLHVYIHIFIYICMYIYKNISKYMFLNICMDPYMYTYVLGNWSELDIKAGYWNKCISYTYDMFTQSYIFLYVYHLSMYVYTHRKLIRIGYWGGVLRKIHTYMICLHIHTFLRTYINIYVCMHIGNRSGLDIEAGCWKVCIYGW